LRSWAANSLAVPLTFAPDGKTLATGGAEGMIFLREALTGKAIRQFQGHPNAVYALAFSPDGRALLSGGDEPTVRLWEVATAREFRRFVGHSGPVFTVAFSQDGKLAVSGSRDTSVLLWDVTGLQIQGTSDRADLTNAELNQLWSNLADDDGSSVYRAIWKLAGVPRQTVPMAQQRLRWLLSANAKKIAQLLANLDDDDFRTRERATLELEKLVEPAESALRKALVNPPSLEVRRRLDRILNKQRGPGMWPRERLRALRVIEVLHMIGNAEAREVLSTLAQSAPDLDLIDEAKAALEQLAR
jgi:hypothetical protein